jgi:predicted double-glycine peptidase
MKGSIALAIGLLALSGSAAWGQQISITMDHQRLSKRVRNFKELRQEGVIVQQLDYSCGAAALATLFTYHFRDRIKEEDIVGFIFVHGQTPEEGLKKYLRRQGFSLLDLKRFAAFRGYKVAGFKGMTVEDLAETIERERLPVLVPIIPMGYSHFVVLKGFQEGRVFMADPAVGNTTMSIAKFEEVWVEGIGFIVSRNEVALGPKRVGSSDADMDRIFAAGTAGGVKPGAEQPVASSLLRISPGIAVPDPARLTLTLQGRQAAASDARDVAPRTQQIIRGADRGDSIIGVFQAPKLSAVPQFGRPAGNFIDFTPPSGKIEQPAQSSVAP